MLIEYVITKVKLVILIKEKFVFHRNYPRKNILELEDFLYS